MVPVLQVLLDQVGQQLLQHDCSIFHTTLRDKDSVSNCLSAVNQLLTGISTYTVSVKYVSVSQIIRKCYLQSGHQQRGDVPSVSHGEGPLSLQSVDEGQQEHLVVQ